MAKRSMRKHKKPVAVSITTDDVEGGPGLLVPPTRWAAHGKLTSGGRVRAEVVVRGSEESIAIRRALYALAAALE